MNCFLFHFELCITAFFLFFKSRVAEQFTLSYIWGGKNMSCWTTQTYRAYFPTCMLQPPTHTQSIKHGLDGLGLLVCIKNTFLGSVEQLSHLQNIWMGGASEVRLYVLDRQTNGITLLNCSFIRNLHIIDPNSQRTNAGWRQSAARSPDSWFLRTLMVTWSKWLESMS